MKLASLLLAGVLCMGQSPTAPASPSPAASPPSTEPSQVVGVGAGIQGLGPSQIQGGFFVAQHIGTNTYTIQATDFVRMPGGTVGTSATAGILNILHRLGPAYLGIVGTAGVAEGATGSASGAVSGWGVLGSTFGNSGAGIVLAAQTTKIAGTGNVAQVRLYFTWSFK